MKHMNSEKHWNKAGRVIAAVLAVIMLLVGCGVKDVNGSTVSQSKASLTIRMSMYGGFEQVGSLGASLPRNDVQTTTSAGDIVLYSGNQMVIFYGSNSWAYTRLGRITDKSAREMAELLGNGDVTVTIGEFE